MSELKETKTESESKVVVEPAKSTEGSEELQTFYFPEHDIRVEAKTLEEAIKKAKIKEGKK